MVRVAAASAVLQAAVAGDLALSWRAAAGLTTAAAQRCVVQTLHQMLLTAAGAASLHPAAGCWAADGCGAGRTAAALGQCR